MKVFVIVNNIVIIKNADVNVKKSLTKWYVIKGLFRVLIIEDVNLINCKFVNLYVINCKFRKKLVDKLVEECSENTDGNKIIHNGSLIDYENVCNSGTMYIVLFVIAFLIIIGISSAFAYFHWCLKRDNSHVTFNTNTQTTIY